MLTVQVDLGTRSYPIYIGANLLNDRKLVAPFLGSAKVLVVSNETVAPLYLEKIQVLLGKNYRDAVILPDGEKFKTQDVVNQIYDKLLVDRFDRGCILVALGGGVVGDVTGFAAATYQRGVNFIQIPTTLLAQVDSSVGGKTGINHALGKNMIGAFHQPLCVIADTSVLKSLPDREFRAGLAEVIKYGLIGDLEFVEWLERNNRGLLDRKDELLSQAISQSCKHKAAIVAQDEREGGVRALLNLGHTFGHAIETATGYSRLLHGEAVAIGMVMAADLSMRIGWISAGDAKRVRQLIEIFGLPAVPPADIDKRRFLELMASDKKVQSGKTRFVLLKSVGHAVIESVTDTKLLDLTLIAGESLCRS
ncbi:MAG: 3-dehydroquinate synthase [Pseudohongiellaceae bacterium]